MDKLALTLLCALLLGGIAAAVVFLGPGVSGRVAPSGDLAAQVASIREELSETRQELTAAAALVAALDARLRERESDGPGDEPREAPAASTAPPEAGADSAPGAAREGDDEFREYIFSLIREERRLKEEGDRRRAEEFRREIEEFSKGPYEGFNLKVNSMAKVLGFDQRQKDRYYAVSRQYRDALQELRKNVNWQDEEARRRVKEDQDALERDFTAEVERMLTAPQLETYQALAPWSRAIDNRGRIAPPGESGSERAFFMSDGSSRIVTAGDGSVSATITVNASPGAVAPPVPQK